MVCCAVGLEEAESTAVSSPRLSSERRRGDEEEARRRRGGPSAHLAVIEGQRGELGFVFNGTAEVVSVGLLKVR